MDKKLLRRAKGIRSQKPALPAGENFELETEISSKLWAACRPYFKTSAYQITDGTHLYVAFIYTANG